MRTTVTLDENLVAEVKRVTGQRTKTAAVALALAELVHYKKIQELRGLLGKVDIDTEVVDAMEQAESEH